MSPAAARLPQAPLQVLREYALVADGERGAVIGPQGDIAWLCFPSWDSPAVFATLIGGRGSYIVAPQGSRVWGGYYEPGTLIWHSRWVTHDGVVECREALAAPGRTDSALVLRRIRVLRGVAEMSMELDLRAGYGLREPSSLRKEGGLWRFQLEGGVRAVWAGVPEARRIDDHRGGRWLRGKCVLREGEQQDLVLRLSTGAEAVESTLDPDLAWEETEAHWANRVPALTECQGRRDARHAYAVMAGLTSMSGGMVAAATTSLPERADGQRNFDYRYAWIRDQCYAGQSVAACGGHDLLDGAVRFVSARILEDGPDLRPAYTAGGGAVPSQQHLSLPGYPGGGDLIGNHVNRQFQLDAFGESLLLFASAGRLDRLSSDSWQAIRTAVQAVEERWQEPEAGIWELEPRIWAHSRLVCAAGLRAVSELPGAGVAASRWASFADHLVADTASRALHPSGRWQRAEDDERVDAALLLSAIRGAVPVDDPRSVATLRSVLDSLVEDEYCFRYRPDARPLGDAEGAFLLCGFMVSLALLGTGDQVGAARWFERTRAACGSPGLLSEEFDVHQRQLRGNLPQAFVHAMLLECGARLGAAGLINPDFSE